MVNKYSLSGEDIFSVFFAAVLNEKVSSFILYQF